MSSSRPSWTLLGVLSLGSGIALICAPLAMATVYGLPRYAALARLIGARDVVIGLRLLGSRRAQGAMQARAASDALDALLISLAGARRRPYGRTAVRTVIALSASGLALSLARPFMRQHSTASDPSTSRIAR